MSETNVYVLSLTGPYNSVHVNGNLMHVRSILRGDVVLEDQVTGEEVHLNLPFMQKLSTEFAFSSVTLFVGDDDRKTVKVG